MTCFSPAAEQIAKLLISKKHSLSVAESSAGGLISAHLLSVAGASAFFVGGAVVYSHKSRLAFLEFDREKIKTLQPLTEAMALEFARASQRKLKTTWAIAELGAAGPAPTPYGHDAGISVIAITGPVDASVTIRTNEADRSANMQAFTEAALELLSKTLLSYSAE